MTWVKVRGLTIKLQFLHLLTSITPEARFQRLKEGIAWIYERVLMQRELKNSKSVSGCGVVVYGDHRVML